MSENSKPISADAVMHCLACDKEISKDKHVCSKECYSAWVKEEESAQQDLERAEADRCEDFNSGCWSYRW